MKRTLQSEHVSGGYISRHRFGYNFGVIFERFCLFFGINILICTISWIYRNTEQSKSGKRYTLFLSKDLYTIMTGIIWNS